MKNTPPATLTLGTSSRPHYEKFLSRSIIDVEYPSLLYRSVSEGSANTKHGQTSSRVFFASKITQFSGSRKAGKLNRHRAVVVGPIATLYDHKMGLVAALRQARFRRYSLVQKIQVGGGAYTSR